MPQGGHHILEVWKNTQKYRTPPGGCQQPQRSPAKHSEAVRPDSGAISGILATGKQILVMWWWFPLRTDLHLQNFRIQVPSAISAFPSADAHESGNMLEHHLPFYKSSNPFQKKQAKVPLLTSSDSSAFISLSISGISGGCSARS